MGTTTEGSFSQFIPKPVIDQINMREKKWEKPNKTVEEFEVIHGNTVWALLRSGVNVPENENDRRTPALDKTKVTTTDKLARQTVLGGEMKREVLDENEFRFGSRAGVELSTPDLATAAYRKDSVQGHRPVPGITGFTVKTKDTWGMIMEANIQIKCWSRDDLEKLDSVYFKPGFPALFEWGHTLYFKEDGSICKTPSPIITNAEFFGNQSYQDYSDLDRRVYERRQQDCNREAVFGYITNFSWSFNPDGSYDCSLQILSKGAVLEGLRMTSVGEEKPDESDVQKDVKWWEISSYHRVLKAFDDRYEKLSSQIKPAVERVEEVGKPPEDTLKLHLMPERSKLDEQHSEKSWIISGKKAIEGDKKIVKVPDGSKDFFSDFPVAVLPVSKGNIWGNRKIEMYYMTLRSLLHLVNVFSGGVGSGGCYFDTLSDGTFGDSGTDHPSLNPLIAVKPSQIGAVSFDIDGNGLINQAKGSQKSPCNGDNQILNIWVNYSLFVLMIENQVGSEPDGYQIQRVVSEFLASIQKAFGNVNHFGLHGNSSSTNYFEVVDRTMVRPEDTSKIPSINITGLKNTVVGLQIKSDISNDIANSMCIAAASPAAKTEGADNADTEVVFWGENCTPRWCVSSNSTTSENVVTQQKGFEEKKIEWFKKLEKFYSEFRQGNFKGKATKDSKGGQEPKDLEQVMQDTAESINFFQIDGERYYRNDDRAGVTEGSYLHMGIIPYKMNLTLLGLSRLYIGNVFMLSDNGILPRKYSDWGYLITGISHTVKNNQWFTELTTNYFPVFSNMKIKAPEKTPSRNFVERLEFQPEEKDPRVRRNIDDDCDYRSAYLNSGIEYPVKDRQFDGLCAWFTYGWAETFVKGRSALGTDYAYGKTGPAGHAGGCAKSPEYRNNLAALGYSGTAETSMTGAEIAALREGSTVLGIPIEEGDILIYENAKHPYGHTCFFDGVNWQSDTNQGQSALCNNGEAGSTFKVRLFKSPGKNKDWDCGVYNEYQDYLFNYERKTY